MNQIPGLPKKNTRLVFIFPYRYMYTEYHNFNCFFLFLKFVRILFGGNPLYSQCFRVAKTNIFMKNSVFKDTNKEKGKRKI